ncbi:MAG TPA: GntR family transcriptional regulator [Negativicutes bacterium]|nr:GntR family transcriptional regulator [Negativicutes bacterium]
MDDFSIPPELTNTKPIREIIYEYLREAILDGRLKPGERLVERDLAEKFRASRTPIREALRKLETEEFLEYLPRRGDIVKGVNPEDIEEVYVLREMLEALAVRRSVSHLTDADIDVLRLVVEKTNCAQQEQRVTDVIAGLREFDMILLNASQMKRLRVFVNSLQESLRSYRKFNLSNPDRREQAVREHQEIFAAILSRDADRAEGLVRRHIQAARDTLLSFMAK